jgi:hypothetical protein
MTKRLLVVFLISGAIFFSDVHSYVASNSLGREIQNCLFDQTQGTFYATTTAATGKPGIIKSTAPVGSSVPFISAFHSNTVGKEYRDIVMVNDKTTTLPVTLAATVLSEQGLYNRFVVTHANAYTLSEIIEDSSVNESAYGVGYISMYDGYVYSDASDDSEILALAASPRAIFSLTRRINNNHFLMPGTAINVHGVTVTADDITIQMNNEAFQAVLDVTDFVPSKMGDIFDASSGAQLTYNDDLRTLYCAPKWIASYYDGVCSVAAYRLNSDTLALTHTPLVTSDELPYLEGGAPDYQNIVGVSENSKTLSVHQMGVMHTTTNKYHLIILGGHGEITETGDNVYALPLVGPHGDYPGALANVSDVLRDMRANNASDLYTAASIEAHVGNGALPWEAGDNGYTMVIVDDTVYVSVESSTVATPGIYYSQAQFDIHGNIVRWGKWTLAAPRALGSEGSESYNQGAVKTFAVNRISGKIWAVPSDDLELVRVPAWTEAAPLVGFRKGRDIPLVSPHESLFNILKDIKRSCGWSVNNFDGEVKLSAYVGTGKVDGRQKIVVIRSTHDDTDVANENFKVIETPSQDPVLSISFFQSSSLGAATGMLLVGTDTALYAYVKENGTGGHVSGEGVNTHNLDDGYWNDCDWQQIKPAIFTGSIVAIDSLYKDLYITQRSKSSTQEDTLYKISYSDIVDHTLADATPVLIHTAGPEGNAPFLLSHAVVPVAGNSECEQLIVGTYGGVYTATLNGGVQNAEGAGSLTFSIIPGTEQHMVTEITRTSDTEVRVLSETSTNHSGDMRLYTAASTNDLQSAVTSLATVPSYSTSSGNGPAGSQIWTDGARKFSILSNQLISHGGVTSDEKISKLESAIFMDRKLKSVDLLGGIVTVVTDTGTVYLK